MDMMDEPSIFKIKHRVEALVKILTVFALIRLENDVTIVETSTMMLRKLNSSNCKKAVSFPMIL